MDAASSLTWLQVKLVTVTVTVTVTHARSCSEASCHWCAALRQKDILSSIEIADMASGSMCSWRNLCA